MVSATNLTVVQQGTAQFTVSLGEQPTADVTVTIAESQGSTDLTMPAQQQTLTFTSADWYEPQTVTIDAGSSGTGTASFTVASTGLSSQTVTADEVTASTSKRWSCQPRA